MSSPPLSESLQSGEIPPRSQALRELAALFLKLGVTAFGGPAAHIAMMEEEVVRRRKWISRQDFLDLLGAANLVPGPNSTELAIHLGLVRAGWPGLVVAGVCFIVPAMAIVMAIAAAYVAFGTLPQIAGMLYFVKPVVLAIIIQALLGLARTALKTKILVFIAGLTLLATAVGCNEILVLLGGGILTLILGRTFKRNGPPGSTLPALAGGPSLMLLAPALTLPTLGAAALPSLSLLFLTFLKIGSVLYGSGYVLLAFLRSDFVEGLQWITEKQLMDAISVGQLTPGPVFTTATFIGYLVGGMPGALVATLGIFLPAFLFVAVSGPLIPAIRKSPGAGAFLDGVNVASLALMAVVTFQLGQSSLTDSLSVFIALVSGLLLFRTQFGAARLVLTAAIVGMIAGTLGAPVTP